MLEGFSTAELFLCWVAWARTMQRLESGIIWRFIHSCVCWLMLATDRDIRWGLPRYPHMASSSGRLGFRIAWGLGSKSKHPKFYHLLWLYLRSHIALLSDLRSQRFSSGPVEYQSHFVREACRTRNTVAAILKTIICHTYHLLVSKALDVW